MSGILDLKSGVKIPATVLQVAAYTELARNGVDDVDFDEEKHIFTSGSIILPSVTHVLKSEGFTPDFSMMDPFYALRGKYIHRAVELYEKGILDPVTIDIEIQHYFEQYLKAREHFPFSWTGLEVRKRHPVYGYAGIIDQVITGSNAYVLYLTKEKYRLEEVKDLRSNLNVFFAALAAYRWKKENLKNEEE